MKWLFGFLLMLSILLFALMQWGGALTGVGKNGQTLAELNPEKIILLDHPVTRQMPGSAVLPALPVAAASAPVAVSLTAPTAVVTASAVVSAPAIVSPPSPAAGHPPLIAPNLPAPAPAPVAAVPAVKAAVKTCMEWGEFSGTDLAKAQKELAGMKLGDKLVPRTVEYASGYWVYIPPLRSKTAVSKKVAEIKAAGIEDYYVLKDSRKWLNAISLGVFKTEEAAKKFQASMKKKGLRTAKVGERKHTLKFTVFALKHIDTEQAARLSKLQKEFKDSELKTLPCSN